MDAAKLRKVRALLDKAQSTQFPEEAEALNTKAAELMQQYGIEQAHLAAAGRATDDSFGTLEISFEDPYSTSKATLLGVIATTSCCRCISIRTGRRATRATVYGFTSDLARVELLYTSLLLQATNQVTRQFPDHIWNPEPNLVTAHRRAWFYGFACAVQARLKAAQAKAATEADTTTPGTALVLRTRSEQVSEHFADEFAGIKSRTHNVSDAEGFRTGHAAGSRARLANPEIGQRRAALR